MRYKLVPAANSSADTSGSHALTWARCENYSFVTTSIEKPADLLLVWPSQARADKCAALGKWAAHLKDACRAKLARAAIEALSRPFSSAAERAVCAEEISDALKRAQQVGVTDLPLLRSAPVLLRRLQPAVEFTCVLGCGARVAARDWIDHERLCCMRQVRTDGLVVIPRTGSTSERVAYTCGVRQDLRPHHDELRARLQAQVRKWNPEALAALIGECAPAEFPELFDRKVCGCLGCRFPAHLVHKAIRRKTELEQMQAQVMPAIERGSVAIDFNANAIEILREIKFEARKEPDASAQFDAENKLEAEETLRDLALVIKTYKEPMCVEGNTGATDPPEYWNQLALNRANLICAVLIQYGVPRFLLTPIGKAGGGAKVRVYER
jgi:hypothetical protein